MNITKIAGAVLCLLLGSVGPLFAYSNTDLMEVTTDQEKYVTNDTILVGAKFTNNTGQSELMSDMPYPGGFTATLHVRPVGESSGANDAYTASLTPVNPNTAGGSGIAQAHSSQVVAIAQIPPRKLKPGLYMVMIVCNIESATFPPSLIFEAVPSKIIRVK